jgi:HlyD family secretion protein
VKTILTVVATLGVVAVLAGAGFWLQSRNVAAGALASIVRVEKVSRGDLTELVQSPGEVQPKEKVSISAKIAARIIEIPPEEGDSVEKDAVLVKLDASDMEANLRSAEARYAAQKVGIEVAAARVEGQKASLEGLKASYDEAQRDLERQKGLLASHDVSQSVVDTAERRLQETHSAYESAQHNVQAEQSNLTVLKHNLEAADAEIARAREDLSYTVISSPIKGTVTTINAKVGELVVTGTMNNAGTVIMEVADLSQMLVVAKVDETDVANVEVGQPVRVHIQAYPGRVFSGKVTSVALARTTDRNASANDAKTFKVEVLLDTQGQRIFSGLTADVEIETRKHQSVVKVPSQAVLGAATDELPQAIRDNNPNVDKSKTLTTVVYRIVDGKAVVTPVTAGASDITDTIILSGVNEGDRIITGPYKVLEQLKHDQLVKEETPTTKPATNKA